MTFHDVMITSQTRHVEFETAILNPKPAVIQLAMTSPKNMIFLRNILSQNKQTKVKKYILLTNEGEKTEKRQNSQNTLLSRRLLWKRLTS